MNKGFRKISINSCVLVMGLSLAGCELVGIKPRDKLPLEPVRKEASAEVFHQLENKTPITPPTSEHYPGTDRTVSSRPQKSRKIASKGAGSYSLNFDEADLGEVAKVVLSDILGQNYVLSPKVAGKVTLQTTEPLTKEELLPALEMVLRMNNAALVKDGKIYHIEPATDALYTSDFSTRGAGYQTRVIPVKNVAVKDIADIIKPLVYEKTILNVDSKRNILVAAGTADEIARVIDMVNTFDIDVLKGRSFGVFPLTHVDPETIIKELQNVFYQKGSKGGEAEFFQFMPIKRLNAVMAVTHQAHYLNDIENWIGRLDKANTASGGGVHIYKVQHVDAKKLAATLSKIFTTSKSDDSSAKVAPGETADSISSQDTSSSDTGNSAPNLSNTGMNNTGTSNTGISGSSTGNGLSGNLSAFATNELENGAIGVGSSGESIGGSIANVGKVKIIADDANNSIIIVATAQDYEVILPAIEQLDLMPLQVLIDATVVEVTLKNELQYGISWYLNHGRSSAIINGAPTSTASSTGTAAATTAAAVATGGLSALYSSGAVQALLSSQATADNLNVISSPSLMVLNNQKAKINVGQQVPIQTGTTSSPLSTGLATANTIQYKDTGVTLEVTPRVNANGMVNMKLKQIVSDAVAVTSTTGIQSPTINKKEIDSSVAVHDGETIVLGGLISDQVTSNKNGFPFLYELPVIGPLFGSTDKKNDKTELVVLITPRVVKSKQDSRVISDEFKRKLTGIYQDNSQISKESSSSKK
ncbi:MAG: type II secretion system secretin GspD [Methylococcales bacterium]|jgi:general secretion pathway protein D